MRHKKLALAALSLILLIGTASAALVYYLSNMVSMTANVTSPIELRLYYPNGTQITSTLQIKGGGSVDFSKIAYNHAEGDIPFAIALVIKGTDGDGVIVDSAGPIDAQKQNIGNHLWTGAAGSIWNRDDLWWQIEGDMWYLHGAHSQAECDAYEYYGVYSGATATWDISKNEKYVDALPVTIGTDKYYVVVFGGTIGNKIGDGPWDATSPITNWGWGSSPAHAAQTGTVTMTFYQRDADVPCIMPAGSYDVGKVRIIFAPNFQGTVTARMQVVMPGSTVAEIIAGMFP